MLNKISTPNSNDSLEKKLNYKYPFEDYLSDDRAIECTKEMKQKIKIYLNSENIKKLIRLITEEPENDDINRGHKFPYVASEILKADCPFILERFILSNEEYIKKYREILDEQIKEKCRIIAEENYIENENRNILNEENEYKENNNNNTEYNNNNIENNNKNEENKEENISLNNKDGLLNNKEYKNSSIDEKNILNEKEIILQNNINNDIKNNQNEKIINKEEINENNDKSGIKVIENKKEIKEQIDENINDKKKDEQNEKNEKINDIKVVNELKELNKNKNIEEENLIGKKNEIKIKKNKKYEEEDNIEEKIKDEVDSVSLDYFEYNQNNEFLDLLLNFVMDDKPELNYVLSGYFSNVIITLLTKYPTGLLNYLYKVRKDALKKIIYRSHQRVFSIIAIKLLDLEKYDDFKKSAEFFEKCINYRNKLIGNIIKSLSLEGFKDESDNLYTDYNIAAKLEFISQLINENKNVIDYILEKNDIYGHILNILNSNLKDEKYYNNFSDIYYKYYLFIKLLIQLLASLNSSENFKYPEEFYLNRMKKEKSQLNFNDYMIITFGNILKNNFVPKKSFQILARKSNTIFEGLGILSIKILELTKEMFSFMRKIPNKLDYILINTNFCQRSFDYFFEYQWNNIYHIKFIELFDIYLKEELEHKQLTKYYFETYKLHEVLLKYLKPSNEKLKYKYKSGNKTKSGIFPHAINLMYKLQVISGLKTITEEEKTKLNILNLGEFEFLKDENSNKTVNRINLSSNIGIILKQSKEWNKYIENMISILVKSYEEKLGEEKKTIKIIKKKKMKDITSEFYDKNKNNFKHSDFEKLANFVNKKNASRIDNKIRKNDKNKNKTKINENKNDIQIKKGKKPFIPEPLFFDDRIHGYNPDYNFSSVKAQILEDFKCPNYEESYNHFYEHDEDEYEYRIKKNRDIEPDELLDIHKKRSQKKDDIFIKEKAYSKRLEPKFVDVLASNLKNNIESLSFHPKNNFRNIKDKDKDDDDDEIKRFLRKKENDNIYINKNNNNDNNSDIFF